MVGNNQAKENWIGVGSEIQSMILIVMRKLIIIKKKKFKQNFYLRTESVVRDLNRHG